MTSVIALAAIMILGVSSVSAEPPKSQSPLDVSGFVGGLVIADDHKKGDLFDEVTVTLSQASASYPDAQKANIGAVVNENGDKYVAWLVTESSYDYTARNGTKTIHVVDAVDVTNTATVTQPIEKNFEHKSPYKIDEKLNKLENRQASSGNPEYDGLKSQFMDVLQELRDAHRNGEQQQVDDLRDQLADIREQLLEMRGY